MNVEKLHVLRQYVEQIEQAPYPVYSRAHALRTLAQCYVKREDELGFGISGSKIRKFRSLIPALLRYQLDSVVLIGGAHSNNILGISQLLIENGLKPHVFIRGEASIEVHGNHLWTRLLLDKPCLHWVPRAEWDNVEHLAAEYAHGLQLLGQRVIVIPEGSALPEALPGMLTLAFDILQNEEQLGLGFRDVWMDAGTGMAAAALICAFAWMEKLTHVHVVVLGDTFEAFQQMLKNIQCHFESFIQRCMPLPTNFTLHRAATAPSFGAVNKRVLGEVSHLARHEGLFVDPIYNAKLFLTARQFIEQHPSVIDKSLIIHSGGGLSLSGYQQHLQELLF